MYVPFFQVLLICTSYVLDLSILELLAQLYVYIYLNNVYEWQRFLCYIKCEVTECLLIMVSFISESVGELKTACEFRVWWMKDKMSLSKKRLY